MAGYDQCRSSGSTLSSYFADDAGRCSTTFEEEQWEWADAEREKCREQPSEGCRLEHHALAATRDCQPDPAHAYSSSTCHSHTCSTHVTRTSTYNVVPESTRKAIWHRDWRATRVWLAHSRQRPRKALCVGLRARSVSGAATGPAVPATPDLRALTDAIRSNDPTTAPRRMLQTPSSSSSSARPASQASSVGIYSSHHSHRQNFYIKNVSVLPRCLANLCLPLPTTASATPSAHPVATDRPFQVGDLVRVESLGMEGTLRYLGPIDGKPGTFAGVELSPGFAGHGKNDGSVNGVAYFTCPPKCGVFVVPTKLSWPAVRPPSVTSSRGGGRHSSMSISSLSNGRTTPLSNGVISPPPRTPVLQTSGIGAPRATSIAAKTPTTPTSAVKYSAGSRASKYAGMTAQQLRSENDPPLSPVAPVHTSTPKANVPRTSLGGIRVPSSTTTTSSTPKANRRTDMLPPPSPIKSNRESINGDDGASSTASLAAANRALQEKIAALTASRVVTPPPTTLSASSSTSTNGRVPTPTSAVLTTPGRTTPGRTTPGRSSRAPTPSPEVEKLNAEMGEMQAERDAAQIRAGDLEAQLKSVQAQLALAQKSAGDIEASKVALEVARKAADTSARDLDAARRETKDVQAALADQEALLASLRASLSETEGAAGERTAVLAAKDAEIASLQGRVERGVVERDEERAAWDAERAELGEQIEELRLAGQETIALYEERLSQMETQKYELEDMLENVQLKLDEASGDDMPAPKPAPAPSAPTTATEIDNETLREQAAHLQTRIQMLEDSRARETALRTKLERFREADERRVQEMGDLRKERDEFGRAKDTVARRVEELEEALREEGAALEDARAEVEGLRAEVTNLGTAQDGRADAAVKDLKSRVASLEKERDALLHTQEQSNTERPTQGSPSSGESSTIIELRQSLEERAAELEKLRKQAQRDRPITPTDNDRLRAPSRDGSRSPSRAEQQEVQGLKHIVQDLTKENVSLQSQMRLLESENKMLIAEAEELRETIKQLEATVEEAILREERALTGEILALDAANERETLPSDVEELRAMCATLNKEIDSLRKQLSAQEQKSARTIHDLNKELSELETLVESKIYREDDLEREVEQLKTKLARSGASDRPPSLYSNSSSRHHHSSSRSSVSTTVSAAPVTASDETVCEICEQPGHDIFTCPVLKGDDDYTSPTTARSDAGDPSQLWCDDCESHGHLPQDCPHSLEVF
ncbi:hypothetical protein BKA62DRAFT_833506 [Auriculariales sp. MPI-PUGE-AT-0066]|nr:hypothetical protein BKA62DRAFT_833506 [Auriculariales sp. MPI-PUGE-AT-0066]